MTTLFAIAYCGWLQFSDWPKYLLAFGLPILLATIWGVFAIQNNPGRSGKTVVITPGWIRLLIEFAFFGFGAWAINGVGFATTSIICIFMVIVHYAVSFYRIKWLISK